MLRSHDIDEALGCWRRLRGADSIELPGGMAIRFVNRLNRANHVHVTHTHDDIVRVCFWRVTQAGSHVQYLGVKNTRLEALKATVEHETGVDLSC